jgi:hypothetical protein
MTVLLSAVRNVLPHIGVCAKNQITSGGGMSTPRADRLLGLPLTIFRGMWLVLSNA